jgi:cobalamin-dependent methionine synthase I
MLLINQDLDGTFNKFTWEMHQVPENLQLELKSSSRKSHRKVLTESLQKLQQNLLQKQESIFQLFPLTQHSSNASHISAAIIRE